MKQKHIIWCPHREERVFVQICKKRCPKSRRQACKAFLATYQSSFDFGPVEDDRRIKPEKP